MNNSIKYQVYKHQSSSMNQTSFINHQTWTIASSKLHSHIKTTICNIWGVCDNNRFPGPLPISIERQHFGTLKSNPYWVCAKTDGLRYLLVCLQYEDRNYCVFVNRKLEMILLDITMLSSAYNGTILDGELVQNNQTKQHEFLVYDSVMVCGENTSKLPHSIRLQKSAQLIDTMIVSPRHTISVHLKTFTKLNMVSEYIQDVLPNLTHSTDGLIFTPEHEEIMSGTHKTMFKWKPTAKNTVDFWVEQNFKKKNSFIIKVSKGRTMICLHDHYVYIPYRIIDKLPCILECSYNGPNNWQYVLERTDKQYPNSLYTMTKTLLNIQENILLSEFCNDM